MKKKFLCLAVFMVTASSFANWEGTFYPSCGGRYHVVAYGNTVEQWTAALQQANFQICGIKSVKIVFF